MIRARGLGTVAGQSDERRCARRRSSTALMAAAAFALLPGYRADAGATRLPTGELELHYELPQAPHETIPYRIYLPSNWTAERQWPLVMILHGYGGNAGTPFEDAGGRLQQLADRHGFILASPNGYNGLADYGANLPLPSKLERPGPPPRLPVHEESALAEADVLNVLERVTAGYHVDRRRIFLMGNSMGMTGVLHLASTRPRIWCAISASGGPPWPGYPAERLHPISGVLLVHGALDDIADPAHTRALADRLRREGIDVRMHLVTDGTHADAWVRYLPETFAFFAERRCD